MSAATGEPGQAVAAAVICRTCGVQHASATPPEGCAICTDERQYVGHGGQRWTTMGQLLAEGFHVEVSAQEPGLTGVGMTPRFAIGQRGLLVQTPAGNVLWDCTSLIDEPSRRRVAELGGIAAIAASHPHFYGVMVEWSRAFDAPIHVPDDDRAWVMRPDPAISLWRGSRELVPGVTVIQCGGHFEGSAVLHWPAGADGRGALLVGDTLTVVADRRYVSFMRSYPNLIPLPAEAVRRIERALAPLAYDRIYGGWDESVVTAGGKEAVQRSAERYVSWLGQR